jgi:hypothetical protein
MQWYETINIKPFLDEENLTIKERAEKMSAKLLKSHFRTSILEELCQDLCNAKSVKAFDAVLNRIYDWADSHKVWLGI